MLEQIKHNEIVTPHDNIKIDHSHSCSSAVIVGKVQGEEITIQLETTTDILTEFLSNVMSILLSVDIILDNNFPKIILREAHVPKGSNEQLQAMWRIKQENIVKSSLKEFSFAIANGMSIDQATTILPVGMTMIKATVQVNIASLMEDIANNVCDECRELIIMAKEATEQKK